MGKASGNAIPFLALGVISVHFFLVSTKKLSPWKGGGFGMYTSIHYFYNDVYVTPYGHELDSLAKTDADIKKAIKTLKLMPNTPNLEKYAKVFYRYAETDSITIQIWKPKVEATKATYTREIVNQLTYYK